MVERLGHTKEPLSQRRKARVARNLEQHPAKEQEWDVHFGALVIIGQSGTGKTSMADMIVEVLKSPEILKIGDVLRKKKNVGGRSKYIERETEEDRLFDEAQKELIITSTPNKPWIIESRLGGFWARKFRDQNENPVVIIRLTADDQVRFERIQKRNEKEGILLSIDEVKLDEEERAKRDRKQWAAAHPEFPELKTIDPYEEAEFEIDTTELKVKEVFDKVMKGLQKLGYITPKNQPKKEPDLTKPKISRGDVVKEETIAEKGTIFEAKNPPQPPVA